MINPPDRRRVGQARLLRRQGKTYDEIRAVIGSVSNDRLQEWMKGIPRPRGTRRSHPQAALAKECRRLRSEGLTHGEIVAKTGASAGSVSLWLRGVTVPRRFEARHQAHLQELRGRGSEVIRAAAAERKRARVEQARQSFGLLTGRDLFVAGVALYWAEGAKQKPWRSDRRVTLINGDPSVFRVFLSWLDLVGVAEHDRRYRLTIHETADVASHERWWADELGLSLDTFHRATLKRHNPNPSRYNRGDTYHGCLVISGKVDRTLRRD